MGKFLLDTDWNSVLRRLNNLSRLWNVKVEGGAWKERAKRCSGLPHTSFVLMEAGRKSDIYTLQTSLITSFSSKSHHRLPHQTQHTHNPTNQPPSNMKFSITLALVSILSLTAAGPLPAAVPEAESAPAKHLQARKTCSWVCGPYNVSNSVQIQRTRRNGEGRLMFQSLFASPTAQMPNAVEVMALAKPARYSLVIGIA